MYDVRHARPKGIWGIDYLLRAQENVHLRMTMVAPEGGDLAIAKGRPPQGEKSYEMTWAILCRKGAAPLASQFLTVLEPFDGDRHVRKIERVELPTSPTDSFESLGVRVTSKGFVDTIIFQANGTVDCMTSDGLECNGEFGFWRERDGRLVQAVLAGGTKLLKGSEGITGLPSLYKGYVKGCDWRKRELIIEPRPEDVRALVGQHIQISNESGNHASYLIEAVEPIEGGWRVTLPFVPRIGEGFVAKCENGLIMSATNLRFWNYWRYYAGKTIANEDGSVAYRLSDVTDSVNCVLDEAMHGKITAETLRTEFADRDGDGRPRFLIYDYGPGDRVTIKRCITMPR